jgi:hypothetical protein
VGDVILLNDVEGIVTYIGLRSTRLLTEANHEMIVANSSLLEDPLTNLTLSDQFVRHSVTIDIDRSRSVAASKLRMLQLVFSHPTVIKSPQPIVLLTEVDCYALRFQIHFWLEHGNMIRCAQVRSEILEMITAEFPCLDGESSASEETPADALADENLATSNGQPASDDLQPKLPAPAPRPDAAMLKSIRQMSRAVLKKEIRQML